MLALMNDSSGKIMATAHLPVKHLHQGHHQSLKLRLETASGQSTQPACLYVTVCLSTAPNRELQRWRAVQNKAVALLQTRITSCSSLLLDAPGTPDVFGVFAVFQTTTDKKPPRLQRLPLLAELHAEVGTSASFSNGVLTKIIVYLTETTSLDLIFCH